MNTFWTVLAIIRTALLFSWYAMIVTRRNRVDEALGAIDVQLTLRHDLVPNLLAIAKRFMAHEHDLLVEITQLRSQNAGSVGPTDPATLAIRFANEQRLAAGVRRLFAVAENYPDLQSQEPMMEARRGLSEVETNIAAARRYYNSAVGDLRNASQIFPGPLLARLASVSVMPPFYESQPDQRAPINASTLL